VPRNTINDYINSIARQGGMALSNGYLVQFDFGSAGVKKEIDRVVVQDKIYRQFCDEAQLPTLNAATGQLTGRYLGEGMVNYAHTRMYSDFSLGWMCDANMEPYKFLHAWWSYIFSESTTAAVKHEAVMGQSYEQLAGKAKIGRNRQVRVRYPKDYQCDIRIAKIERGPNSETERVSIIHILEDAFPYTIDSVPLSFGASQLTKATANFYYSKHTTVYNDNRPVNRGGLTLAQNFLDGNFNLNLGSFGIA